MNFLIGLLIPGWIRAGSPDHGLRFRLICWAWWRDDQRAMGEQTWRSDAPEPGF